MGVEMLNVTLCKMLLEREGKTRGSQKGKEDEEYKGDDSICRTMLASILHKMSFNGVR